MKNLARRYPRALPALFTASTLAVVLLCVAYAWGPEHAWMIAQVQYIPYPVFLAPTLAIALLSLGFTARWRVVAFCAPALVATVLMDLNVNWPAAPGARLRVMTYNVKGYIGDDEPGWLLEVAHEVARHDPDVLVLQDARELGGIPKAALDTLFGGRDHWIFGQYVIASRHPLRDCSQGRIPYRDQTHTFARCVIDAAGTEIDVVTAHLLTPRSGLNAIRHEGLLDGASAWRQNVEDRMEQALELSRQVSLRRRPMVLAGDFNSPATSLVVRTLESTGLRNAFSDSGLGYGHTFGHSLRLGFSFLRLDHVFASAEFRVLDCFVGAREASSHRPVIADLALREARS